MTTPHSPTEVPAVPPPAEGPATDILHGALADLVETGTLTQDQADAVARTVAARAGLLSAPVGMQAAPARPAWRGRLLEASVYLGAAFVLAAVGIVIGTSWGDMPKGVQITLVVGLTVLGLVAGLVVGLPVRPAPHAPLDPTHAIRRRSASVILTATAGLATGATWVALGEDESTGAIAFGVGLAVMVLTQVVAPSVLSELALAGAGAAFVGATAAAVLPEPVRGASASAWQVRDRAIAAFLLGFGALWAWWLARLLRHRLLGVSAGLVICVAAGLAFSGTERAGAIALALVAVACVLTYLRDPEWPWITAGVVAATFAVFQVAGDALGVAVAFLAAGLVLLGGVAVVVILQRRRAAAEHAGGDHPGSGTG